MEIDKTLVDHYERQIEVPLVKDYCKRQKEKGLTKVVDIGGAESLYLEWLLNNGFDVTVLDPCAWHDNQNYKQFVNNPNFHVIQNSIFNVSLTKEKYDFALLISTLEHLGTGSYNGPVLQVDPEVICFKNIELPFAMTTPMGKDHIYGQRTFCNSVFGDKNYSKYSIINYLTRANKEILKESFYRCDDWAKEVSWNDIKDCMYGVGATAIGYYEIK